MGTTITTYINDANIFFTYLTYYLSGLGATTVTYDYNTFGGTGQRISFGDNDKVSSVKFEAKPRSSSDKVSYSFVRWVYWVGDIEAEQQYSYDNPFTFSEKNSDGTLKSIHIRAEGESAITGGDGGDGEGETGDGTYKLIEMPGIEIRDDGHYDFYGTPIDDMSEYFPDFTSAANIYRYPIRSTVDAVCFMSAGNDTNIDTVGYLTESTGWNSSNGIPNNYIAYNDDASDSEHGFLIDAFMEKDKTYYLWVKSYGDETETVFLDIWYHFMFVKWDWNSSGDKQIAKYAIDNRGRVKNFSNELWKELVNFVYDIISFCEQKWDTTYARYIDTRRLLNGELTATSFNSLRNNVDKLGVLTNIPERNSGDIVYGSYFNTLVDCVNHKIDLLYQEYKSQG